jgi:hypothetical protein
MQLLFIDANIYLRFYDSNQPEYKKLLTTVVEVKDAIFITEQLVSEVNRNKLDVFQSGCSDEVMDDSLKSRILPAHFDHTSPTAIKEWNKKREELEETTKRLATEKVAIHDNLLSEISASQDVVSKELQKVFSSAKKSTEEQMQRAILRKRLGNPPGKPHDPLGDQISWEQLLDSVSGTADLWIISNDRDYFNAYRGKCYLSPYLSSEIHNAAKHIKNVKCFNKLTDGLKDYNDHLSMKLISLPAEDELKQISKSEDIPSLSGYTSGSVGFSPSYSGIQNVQLINHGQPKCPSCHSSSGVLGPVITIGGPGEFLDTFVCQSCGRQWGVTRMSE